MPHKVNPIDFENAEGNLGLSNSMIQHFQVKLPTSRLQRDLTDSTVMRNIGMIFGYTLKSVRSIRKGLSKLIINIDMINSDLDDNWCVVTEGMQMLLRLHGYEDPYNELKLLSRGTKLTWYDISRFIEKVDVDDHIKDKLSRLSPKYYTGYTQIDIEQ